MPPAQHFAGLRQGSKSAVTRRSSRRWPSNSCFSTARTPASGAKPALPWYWELTVEQARALAQEW